MRVVVAVKPIGGKSASRLTRYIAEEGIDRGREGKRRQLFSEKDDDLAREDLTYRGANQYLSRGNKTLRRQDLTHVVISFSEEDFAALGANDEERKEALQEVIREAMERTRVDLGVAGWQWVAGIHLNTEHPHAHIAIHKKVLATDRGTGRHKRSDFRNLGNFPKRMLPHSERGPDGIIRPVAGEIGEHVIAALERAQTRARTTERAREEAALIPPEIIERDKERQKERIKENLLSPEELRTLQMQEEVATRRKELITGGEQVRNDLAKKNDPLWIDHMLEIASRAPSRGGRDLTIELIERGPKPEPVARFNPRDDIKDALRNLSLDDKEYRTQPEQARELGKHSPTLRALFEDGAMIKGNTLIIPAEEHQVPGERDHLRIIQLSHAYEKIQDRKLAAEFHSLARTIAGETTDTKTEIEVFRNFFDQLELDAEGNPLERRAENYEQQRAESLNRVLAEMRSMAGEMAQQETRVSIDVIPSMTEPSSVYRYIQDYERAAEFYSLAQKLAGPDADQQRETTIFALYYWKLERDSEGHKLAYGNEAGRLEAIDRTLEEMRKAVDGKEIPEPPEPAEIVHGVVGFDEIASHGVVAFDRSAGRESGLEEEEELSLDDRAADYDVDDDALDLDGPDDELAIGDAYDEREADAVAWQFNTASRRANLTAERLRFPEGLTEKTLKWLIESRLPEIDRRLERGEPLQDVIDKRGQRQASGIISDIDRLVRPDRPELLNRVSKAAGFDRDESLVRPANQGETAEARRTLFELAIHEGQELESNRGLRARLAAAEGRQILEGRGFLARRQARIDGLVEGLEPQVSGPGGNRQAPPDISPADGRLLVSLSNDPNAPRLPVSNIRVYDQIEKMAQGARLQLYARTSRDGAALVNGLTEEEHDLRVKVVGFLKGYVRERLGDPETRLTHDKEIFRVARKSLDGARDPDQINRLAYAFMNKIEHQGRPISEQERELIFLARPPAHYTQEMIELRQTWGLPREGRRQALRDGKLPPSTAYKTIRGDLDRRLDVESVRQFQRSLLKPPEEMDNPSRLPLYRLHNQLLSHEKDDIYLMAERAKRELPSRERPAYIDSKAQAKAGGRAFGAVPQDSKSYQEYIAALSEINQQLIDETRARRGEGRNISREEQAELRLQARSQAWSRLVPSEVRDTEPGLTAIKLSDTIARLQEKVQPRAALANQVLEEFSSKNIPGYNDGRVSKKALARLDPHIREQYEQLRDYAQRTREEFYRGFEEIDGMRAEIEKARTEEIMKDRRALGVEIVTRAMHECAKFDHELARDFGHTFRFRIYDESTKGTRELSAHDVEQRANSRGVRETNERLVQRAEDRHQIRQEVSSKDLHQHAETLAEHRSIQMSLVAKRGEELGEALDAYFAARESAQAVNERYQKRGEPSPAPFVDRQALSEAQEETIKRGLVVQTSELEQVRLSQSLEFNRPARTDEEAARLRAQLFVARTDLRAREDRLEKYDQTRHLQQWEIPKELRGRKVKDDKISLADVDRRIEGAIGRSTFFGNDGELHIFGREKAKAEVKALVAIRERVVEMISGRRNELSGKVDETRRLVEVLSQARERESEYRAQTGKAMPEPQFTLKELKRVEENAAALRSASLLRQFNGFERRFNSYADPKERISLDERLARARGREVVAKAFLYESAKNQADFQAMRQVQPLLVEVNGRLITNRFLDTQPQSLLEKVIRDRIETPADQRLNEATVQALQRQEQLHKNDVKKHQDYYQAAHEITAGIAGERRNGGRGPLPAPEFSSKEEALMDRYINRLTEKERTDFLAFIDPERSAPARQAAHNHSNGRSNEAASAREPQSANLGRTR